MVEVGADGNVCVGRKEFAPSWAQRLVERGDTKPLTDSIGRFVEEARAALAERYGAR